MWIHFLGALRQFIVSGDDFVAFLDGLVEALNRFIALGENFLGGFVGASDVVIGDGDLFVAGFQSGFVLVHGCGEAFLVLAKLGPLHVIAVGDGAELGNARIHLGDLLIHSVKGIGVSWNGLRQIVVGLGECGIHLALARLLSPLPRTEAAEAESQDHQELLWKSVHEAGWTEKATF